MGSAPSIVVSVRMDSQASWGSVGRMRSAQTRRQCRDWGRVVVVAAVDWKMIVWNGPQVLLVIDRGCWLLEVVGGLFAEVSVAANLWTWLQTTCLFSGSLSLVLPLTYFRHICQAIVVLNCTWSLLSASRSLRSAVW